ncbi:quinone oxidoreductase family protein [Sphingoaurantiacus capsulatus]|uniref:Quinone oxidoreductase family protein n=1 Tax=Sphingoaurantiacus capsulatus TaxID=1771310 RepID=A0ABV7XG39_9SPHN
MVRARVASFATPGGPEVIDWQDAEIGAPGAGEVLVRQTAIGLNYIDTYHRSGLYPLPLPSGLGTEAAGVVEAVGDGVSGFSVGDRVAYFSAKPGAYATHRLVGTYTLVKLPDSIDDRTAAASLLKGLTTEFLVERCAKVQAGETVLVHAAAGGVGLLLVQWLKAIGARVIGTTSSPVKAELAKANGCDEVILYTREEVAPRVRELTSGAGVRVVIDGVGRDTFASSIDSLSPRGLMISYGNASGPVTAFELGLLARKGSLFVTRPTLFDYCRTRAEVEAASARLFKMLASGKVKVRIDQSYALEDAAAAHRDLEARATTGSTILLP